MEKINGNMSMMDMIMVMCEGNPGAMTVLMKMLEEPTGILEVLCLDHYEIRGAKIWMLYKDCCGENMDRFYKTLRAIRMGAYSQDEVHQNLGLPYAFPFLSTSVKEEDYMEEGEKEISLSKRWNEYIQANRELLIPRLEEMKNRYGKRQ